jgi:hypothetical protein
MYMRGEKNMFWNWIVYCVTTSAIFCQTNPEIHQIPAQNYAAEQSCVIGANEAAQKYKWDNSGAEFEYSCSEGQSITTDYYQPKRRR